jgi:hypothetical protein
VKHEWDAQRQREENEFACDEGHQIPSLWARDAMVADTPQDHVLEVVEQVPLDDEQAVQRPDVQVLPAVEPVSFLVGR